MGLSTEVGERFTSKWAHRFIHYPVSLPKYVHVLLGRGSGGGRMNHEWN